MKLISSIPNNFKWSLLSELFQSVGWGYRCPKKLEMAFSQSNNICLAFDGEGLVGCGRSIDDGEFYSMLVDVIVSPDKQNAGVGKAIVCSLTSALSNVEWVMLASEVGKEEFYLKQGFKKMKYGYMLPKSDMQQETYCEA